MAAGAIAGATGVVGGGVRTGEVRAAGVEPDSMGAGEGITVVTAGSGEATGDRQSRQSFELWIEKLEIKFQPQR